MKTGLARIWAHLSHDSRLARRIFPDAALSRIEQAVAEGERRHGAEVRVAIEASVPWHRTIRSFSPRERALEVFSEQRVWDTEANNGVLLYLLLADQAIVVVAARAATAALGGDTMQRVCERIRQGFRDHRHEEGVLAALEMLNEGLAKAFPIRSADADELPNRPVRL
jgi:uncharacterized membrane protein